MPTRGEIAAAISQLKGSGQDSVRKRYLSRLNKLTARDTIVYFSSYNVQRPHPVPSASLSVSPDDIQGFMASLHKLKGTELDLILHSPGGSVEAAEQIVQYLRAKYKHIRVIIPQNAMSAATMIACAADEIVMGKHSAIGPIDPQMTINGATVPAHTILQDFDTARRDVAENPLLANLWGPRLASLPPGILNLCFQATQLSELKVRTWLSRHMLKGDQQKAGKIAAWLANFDEHKTHGRPIDIELARSQGLVVSALEDDQPLQEAVLSVFHATMVTFQATGCLKVIENHLAKGLYVLMEMVPPQPQQLRP